MRRRIFSRRCDWFAGGGEPDKVNRGEGMLRLSHNSSVIGTTFGDGGRSGGQSIRLPLPLKILLF